MPLHDVNVTTATPADALSTPPERTEDRSLAERYRVLLDVGRTLTGTLELEDLYREIYRQTGRVMEATGFYIALYDGATDLATVVFYADRGEQHQVEISYRGSESTVLQTGEAAVLGREEGTHPVLFLGDEDTEVTRSAVAAPLRYEGRAVGALSAQSYRPGAYDDDDLELLQGIADLAAVAVENARYVTEVERRRREAEKIEEIGRALAASLDTDAVLRRVVDAALAVLPIDASTVWLLEGRVARVAESRGEVPLPRDGREIELPEALLGRLREEGNPLVIGDVRESELLPGELRDLLRTRSAVVIPVRMGSRPMGALSVGSVEARDFDEEEVRLLQTLASQASVALENARLHERLQSLSLTDPLTGLPNRRQLELELNREFAAAKRGRALTIVLFDLDHFKDYNDRHGHVAGDEALSAFADILADESRAMNLVARYGGDEFISILSDTDVEGGHRHARRIQEGVREHPLLGPAEIGVSWGVAEHEHGHGTVSDLIRAADDDLYAAKGGRATTDAHRTGGAGGG